jgi:hypothetical protein
MCLSYLVSRCLRASEQNMALLEWLALLQDTFLRRHIRPGQPEQ